LGIGNCLYIFVKEEEDALRVNLGILSSFSRIIALSFSKYSFFKLPSGICPIKSNKNSFWNLFVMTLRVGKGDDS